MERDGKDLAHPREFGTHEPTRAGADMAGDAFHARMRRILIRGELRRHHRVAGLSAEFSGIHVRDAAVGGRSKNDDVQKCGRSDHEETMTHDRLAQIDFRIDVQELAAGPKAAAPQQNPDRHEQQAEDEDPWQNQENKDADIRMRRTGQEEIVEPESDERHRAGGRKDGTDE